MISSSKRFTLLAVCLLLSTGVACNKPTRTTTDDDAEEAQSKPTSKPVETADAKTEKPKAKSALNASPKFEFSCRVDLEKGNPWQCREFHAGLPPSVNKRNKLSCEMFEGEVTWGKEPCPSGFVAKCVDSHERQTTYRYDRKTLKSFCTGPGMKLTAADAK